MKWTKTFHAGIQNSTISLCLGNGDKGLSHCYHNEKEKENDVFGFQPSTLLSEPHLKSPLQESQRFLSPLVLFQPKSPLSNRDTWDGREPEPVMHPDRSNLSGWSNTGPRVPPHACVMGQCQELHCSGLLGCTHSSGWGSLCCTTHTVHLSNSP